VPGGSIESALLFIACAGGIARSAVIALAPTATATAIISRWNEIPNNRRGETEILAFEEGKSFPARACCHDDDDDAKCVVLILLILS
jgi:hypothetical protein